MRSAGYHEKMIGRTYFGGDQVTQLNLVLYNTIKWPYQPKHSPSLYVYCSYVDDLPTCHGRSQSRGMGIAPSHAPTMLQIVVRWTLDSIPISGLWTEDRRHAHNYRLT